MSENQDLIVSHEVSAKRLLVLAIGLFGIGATVMGALTVQNVRSKAAVPVVSPSPFVEIVPPPQTGLVAPFIRLVTMQSKYNLLSTVPVSVYMDTGDQEVSESTVQLAFDPNVLEISQDDIQLEPVFKSMEANIFDNIITITMFVNTELGYPSVQTQGEQKVATLFFKTKTEPKDRSVIAIDFEKNNPTKTSMFAAGTTRDEEPENLLTNVEEASFAIAP
ncbi:hypothetical protein C4579_04115 [Candidatus Microgenomates bacterium]|nr:MAG: hypothetical protein C4579_04115 [Candidatus Microgenomates bacterium]